MALYCGVKPNVPEVALISCQLPVALPKHDALDTGNQQELLVLCRWETVQGLRKRRMCETRLAGSLLLFRTSVPQLSAGLPGRDLAVQSCHLKATGSQPMLTDLACPVERFWCSISHLCHKPDFSMCAAGARRTRWVCLNNRPLERCPAQHQLQAHKLGMVALVQCIRPWLKCRPP